MIIVLFGLPGCGKSTVASHLSKRLNAEVINSDLVRKRLAGISPLEKVQDRFEKGIYSPSMTEKVYSTMVETAIKKASSGKTVILDATFKSKKHRDALKKLAKGKGINIAFFFLQAPEEVIKERLERRKKEKNPSDADWNIYLKMKASFDPPEDAFIIDANRDAESIACEIEKIIKEDKAE